MKTKELPVFIKRLTFAVLLLSNLMVCAQETPVAEEKSHFWDNVQVGGGLGLAVGSGFTNISILPSAIYNFNQYVAAGVGLQYSYLKQRDFYSSSMYGGSVIGLFNPIEQVQLSVELEQLRVNLKSENAAFTDDFWNTGLFLGAGYRMDNVTIGARYNVLFVEDKGVYGDAFMPFIRVYF